MVDQDPSAWTIYRWLQENRDRKQAGDSWEYELLLDLLGSIPGTGGNIEQAAFVLATKTTNIDIEARTLMNFLPLKKLTRAEGLRIHCKADQSVPQFEELSGCDQLQRIDLHFYITNPGSIDLTKVATLPELRKMTVRLGIPETSPSRRKLPSAFFDCVLDEKPFPIEPGTTLEAVDAFEFNRVFLAAATAKDGGAPRVYCEVGGRRFEVFLNSGRQITRSLKVLYLDDLGGKARIRVKYDFNTAVSDLLRRRAMELEGKSRVVGAEFGKIREPASKEGMWGFLNRSNPMYRDLPAFVNGIVVDIENTRVLHQSLSSADLSVNAHLSNLRSLGYDISVSHGHVNEKLNTPQELQIPGHIENDFASFATRLRTISASLFDLADKLDQRADSAPPERRILVRLPGVSEPQALRAK
ncbi:MAG: hypothetical protein DWQ01_04385 [Planctomycetota bacterium]|nr:MAG: hypothetical protein DWQ01_04385 [Planctomycetota bacterium]